MLWSIISRIFTIAVKNPWKGTSTKELSFMNKYIIYTDGSVDDNTVRINKGGSAFVILNEKMEFITEKTIEGRDTTNNRMELIAVIEAIKEIKFLNKNAEIIIYSDSQYVVNPIKKGWLWKWIRKKWKNVKNPDLWQEFCSLWDKNISLIWTKGHSDDEWNNYVDNLSRFYQNETIK